MSEKQYEEFWGPEGSVHYHITAMHLVHARTCDPPVFSSPTFPPPHVPPLCTWQPQRDQDTDESEIKYASTPVHRPSHPWEHMDVDTSHLQMHLYMFYSFYILCLTLYHLAPSYLSAGALAALGAAAFALGCQTAAFHAYRTMKDPNPKKWLILKYGRGLLGEGEYEGKDGGEVHLPSFKYNLGHRPKSRALPNPNHISEGSG